MFILLEDVRLLVHLTILGPNHKMSFYLEHSSICALYLFDSQYRYRIIEEKNMRLHVTQHCNLAKLKILSSFNLLLICYICTPNSLFCKEQINCVWHCMTHTLLVNDQNITMLFFYDVEPTVAARHTCAHPPPIHQTITYFLCKDDIPWPCTEA